MDKRFDFDILLTEVGNARRLLTAYGSDIRYCKEFKMWMVWNGKYWERDTSGHHVMALMKHTIQEMRNEAKAIIEDLTPRVALMEDDDEQKAQLEQIIANAEKTYDWSVKSESDRSIKGSISQAASEPGCVIHDIEFDTHPMFLNVQNGTINLETCELMEFERKDYLTKISPATYDANATAACFTQFLKDIFPEDVGLKEPKALIEFMQRVCGYALTGLIIERILLFLMGNGANGKSALINILLLSVFGIEQHNYGMEASFRTFIQSRFPEPDKPRNDLMRLRGKRFVTASESDDATAKIDTENLKKLSGDNFFSGRANYQEDSQFKPQAKLFLQMNNEPRIMDTTESIWSRVKKIPFNASFKTEDPKTDVNIAKRIASTEASGILNWLLDGLRAVQSAWKTGEAALPPPADVKAATEQYRKDQSQVGRFLEENYQITPNSAKPEPVSSSLLYQQYESWCNAQGEYKRTQAFFSGEMTRYYKALGRAAFHVEKRAYGDGRKMHWFGIEPLIDERPEV